MIQVFHTIAGLQCYLQDARIIGFVPTMGALHKGHASLMQRASAENACVVVSIFVNPLQFAPGEDFDQYPRHWAADLALCEKCGVSVIFAPSPSEVVPIYQVIPPEGMTKVLCGSFRPGHFTGVCTIVCQLLHIVKPNRLYLGQKDAQQLAILRKMVEDWHFGVEVISCPTIRESSGLAISSRNQYLNPDEKEMAAVLYQALCNSVTAFQLGEHRAKVLIDGMHFFLLQHPQIRVEYIECVNAYTLTPIEIIMDGVSTLLGAAVYVNQIRLIDNVLLQKRRPILAIDGPAGAGKSTVAQEVARQLNLLYLDTGAMYRGITWAVLQANVSIENSAAIVEIASQVKLELTQDAKIFVNNVDVTQVIRTNIVSENVSKISSLAGIRQILVKEQQALGRSGGIVIEGRDIGTHVFPDAEVKIYLTASPQERAKRRQLDLAQRQLPVPDLVTIVQSIQDRDYKDTHRAISPLRQAADATLINTNGLSIEAVVEKIILCYKAKIEST